MLLMHDDIPDDGAGDWQPYIATLQQAGCFRGGSAIGDGICARKSGSAPQITRHISGYIRIGADSLDHARALLHGNPVFEAGGTVEIRELPETG
jgi:hypothetical protein